MSPYRSLSTIEPKPKLPILCRIGLHYKQIIGCDDGYAYSKLWYGCKHCNSRWLKIKSNNSFYRISSHYKND